MNTFNIQSEIELKYKRIKSTPWICVLVYSPLSKYCPVKVTCDVHDPYVLSYHIHQFLLRSQLLHMFSSDRYQLTHYIFLEGKERVTADRRG